MRMSDLGERVDVGNVAVGVAEGLYINRLGVRLDCSRYFLEVVNVNKGRVNAVERKRVRQQVSRTAVDSFLGYDVLALLCESLNCVCDCRRAGSQRQACNAALERRYPVLKNALSGVGESAVDVARVGKSEAVGGVLRVMKNV